MANIYDRTRQPLAELNATLTHAHAAVDTLTRRCGIARRPYVLWSRRGDLIARYGSLEAMTTAARRYDAMIERDVAR
jgi:hypothetical protein